MRKPKLGPRPPPDEKLTHAFYERDAVAVAKALIGTILVRRRGDERLRARIVETEAYVGERDLASHASKGRTLRTEPMFGPAGRAYVYLIYGMHEMFNIVTATEGDAQAVLIRAAEPLDGWVADLSGPGKLAKRFGITRAENNLDLTGDTLYLTAGEPVRPRIVARKRIGVDYAQDWKDALLRFCDGDSSAVSRPRG